MKQSFSNQQKTPLKVDIVNAKWVNNQINELKKILTTTQTTDKRPERIAKYGNFINRTGALAKSYKLLFKKIGGTTSSITFQSIYYGKYVRAYYIKNRNIDIWDPLKKSGLQKLITLVSQEVKGKIINEIKESFQYKNK